MRCVDVLPTRETQPLPVSGQTGAANPCCQAHPGWMAHASLAGEADRDSRVPVKGLARLYRGAGGCNASFDPIRVRGNGRHGNGCAEEMLRDACPWVCG